MRCHSILRHKQSCLADSGWRETNQFITSIYSNWLLFCFYTFLFLMLYAVWYPLVIPSFLVQLISILFFHFPQSLYTYFPISWHSMFPFILKLSHWGMDKYCVFFFLEQLNMRLNILRFIGRTVIYDYVLFLAVTVSTGTKSVWIPVTFISLAGGFLPFPQLILPRSLSFPDDFATTCHPEDKSNCLWCISLSLATTIRLNE